MKTHNQGDMFVVEMCPITKLEGELAPDEIVLRVRSLSVDQVVFNNAVEEAFVGDKVELLGAFIKVTLVENAEHLRDQKDDFLDTELFLEQIAKRILAELEKTPGWGDTHVSPDKRADYDLLD